MSQRSKSAAQQKKKSPPDASTGSPTDPSAKPDFLGISKVDASKIDKTTLKLFRSILA